MDRRNFIKTGAVFGGALAAPVEWVTVDEPDHDDDTDNRTDRVSGFTPNRIQAQDKGAAYFDRLEGMWSSPGFSKIYFDTTTGGAANLGQGQRVINPTQLFSANLCVALCLCGKSLRNTS